MNNFPAMPVLTQEQQKIITDTCNVMVNRADSSEHSQNLRVVAQIALAALTAEPDYVRYSCGCCGYESLSYKHICPKCNHHTLHADKLYTAPPAPVLRVPDGWKLVPIEPTEDMVIRGFESKPDQFWSTPEEWAEYEAMSGCQQAAHKATLCWQAMLAAAPEVE